MALENIEGPGKYLCDLNRSWPLGATDLVDEGDNHIRGVKNTTQNTFPNLCGEVTASHTELSTLKDQAINVKVDFDSIKERLDTLEHTVNTVIKVIWTNLSMDGYHQIFPEDPGHQLGWIIINGPHEKPVYHNVANQGWHHARRLTDIDGDVMSIVPSSTMIQFLPVSGQTANIIDYQLKLGDDGDPDQWLSEVVKLRIWRGDFTFNPS